MEYIIVGSTEQFDECLVRVCGRCAREEAERMLQDMIDHPTDTDKYLMRGHTNLRVKEVADKDAWWRDPILSR